MPEPPFGTFVQVNVRSSSETWEGGSHDTTEFGRVVNWSVDHAGAQWVKVELMPANPVKIWARLSDTLPWTTPHRDLGDDHP